MTSILNFSQIVENTGEGGGAKVRWEAKFTDIHW